LSSLSPKLVLHLEGEGGFSGRLEAFAGEIVRRCGGAVALARGEGAILPEAAAGITVCRGGRCNLHFLMVPEHYELEPFLRALRPADEPPVPAGIAERLASMTSPAEIRVLVSVHCPNCPAVVDAAARLAAASPAVTVYVIDAQVYPRTAEERGILAVPAVLIDRELVVVGPLGIERMADLLLGREQGRYEVEACRSWLLRGRTAEAVLSLGRERYRRAWVDLFQEPELSTRMGVLVMVERALESHPEWVRSMVPLWLPLLEHRDARIRGDVADLLGRIGDRRALPHLERLCEDPDPDVAEAAAEAVGALRDAAGGESDLDSGR